MSIQTKVDKTSDWEGKAVTDQFAVGQENQDGDKIAEKDQSKR